MSQSAEDVGYRLTLSPEAEKVVRELCILLGNVPIQEAVRRAIGDELFIRRKIAHGWRVQIQKGRFVQELVWSDLS